MSKLTLTHQLLHSHLASGRIEPGAEIGLHIDQTLTQDATGTLVMLELEAMGAGAAKTEVSVQYVDHNLVQEDFRNADDHLFLESACRRYGLWFSRAGNGVSHPVHMAKFGAPGKTLLGSDSHSCAAGSLGMLALGAGGIEVALALQGEPYFLHVPAIWGIRLKGQLPDWVSAKDVILELLRRHGVSGGIGRLIEYHGPGVESLSAMDRHVIANMGAELGATTSIFPSDGRTLEFLRQQSREEDWQPLAAERGAEYEFHDEIDLSKLQPLIAKPGSPGNVVSVSQVAGTPIYQAYIGSSANPGYRDFAVAAQIVKGRRVPAGVSFDVNPSSREILLNLLSQGHIAALLESGARLHQAGCNGCIGMGQAPASGRNSLRTVPRNFPGRSGSPEDSVWLCSPETAAASALAGAITDPRTLGLSYRRIEEPKPWQVVADLLTPPPSPELGATVELVKGPNIVSLPALPPLPDELTIPILLKVGDDVSTDAILPGGTRVLPYRSNIPRISDFLFESVDPGYARRAQAAGGGHAIVAGDNYGQGSSREHAALAPRSLGLWLVLAKRFARIHRENLVNFGILPLVFRDPADYDRLQAGGRLSIARLYEQIRGVEGAVRIKVEGQADLWAELKGLSQRQRELLLRGGALGRAQAA